MCAVYCWTEADGSNWPTTHWPLERHINLSCLQEQDKTVCTVSLKHYHWTEHVMNCVLPSRDTTLDFYPPPPPHPNDVCSLQTPNLLELAVLCQSLRVGKANNGVFRKGKLQQRFFSKYTWKMAFVLSRIRSGTLRTLCKPRDVGYSCNFSKK